MSPQGVYYGQLGLAFWWQERSDWHRQSLCRDSKALAINKAAIRHSRLVRKMLYGSLVQTHETNVCLNHGHTFEVELMFSILQTWIYLIRCCEFCTWCCSVLLFSFFNFLIFDYIQPHGPRWQRFPKAIRPQRWIVNMKGNVTYHLSTVQWCPMISHQLVE